MHHTQHIYLNSLPQYLGNAGSWIFTYTDPTSALVDHHWITTWLALLRISLFPQQRIACAASGNQRGSPSCLFRARHKILWTTQTGGPNGMGSTPTTPQFNLIYWLACPPPRGFGRWPSNLRSRNYYRLQANLAQTCYTLRCIVTMDIKL